MYKGIIHLHSFLRWVILLLLIAAIVRHLVGMINKKPYTNGDRKTDLILMTTAHIQFLIGIIQWFIGDFGFNLLRNGSEGLMADPVRRFWVVEHPLGMVIAVALITIGRGVSKKNISDASKHKRIFWFFLIALIAILAAVPWPGREGIARPMF
jgi:hypothetical protein